MTVYLAIPPDRLRTSLGFVRGFIGLALDAMTAVPGRPAHRVAFFLDEFGQLGRLDALVGGLTLMRGYGVQLGLFVQDLSQLKAIRFRVAEVAITAARPQASSTPSRCTMWTGHGYWASTTRMASYANRLTTIDTVSGAPGSWCPMISGEQMN